MNLKLLFFLIEFSEIITVNFSCDESIMHFIFSYGFLHPGFGSKWPENFDQNLG